MLCPYFQQLGHSLYQCNDFQALDLQKRNMAFAERNKCTNAPIENTSLLGVGVKEPVKTVKEIITTPYEGSALQTSVLSKIPAKIAPQVSCKHMWLGILVVEICNTETGEKKYIYAFHDIRSEMTLLRKSTVEEISLHIEADVLMKNAFLFIHGLTENEFQPITTMYYQSCAVIRTNSSKHTGHRRTSKLL